MATADETVLLKSTLELQGKAYSVKLTSLEIYWEDASSTRAAGGPYSEPLVKNENQTVKLCEVLACRLGAKDSRASDTTAKFQNLEMVSLSPTAFSLWVVRRIQKHKWRDRKVTFHSKDTSVIQQWVDKVQEILAKPEFNRPKSLLVFINPVSGKKLGPKLYHTKVAPLLELAGITTEVVTTQRQNHARDTLMDYDLVKVDGVVCVGGDGMFTEVLHGLLNRTLQNNGIAHMSPDTPLSLYSPTVRVGIIPAGSTDTVIFSAQGCNDAITSALHIVIGDQMAMDVGAAFRGNQFIKYNVSLMGYGYYGDCILDSEQNRWMGPKRYDWEGFKKVVSKRIYEGELSFIASTDKENHPRDQTRCKAGCAVCRSIGHTESNGYQHGAKEEENWQHVRGRFIAINSFLISCRCRFAVEGPAPTSHLGDGCADLVVISECSRVDYVHHLIRCTQKNQDQYDFPFIQVYRVKQFKFRPLVDEIDDTHEAADAHTDGQQRLRSRVSHNSVWNCDGEVIDEPAADFKVYRQVIKLFARGVEDENARGDSACNCMGK